MEGGGISPYFYSFSLFFLQCHSSICWLIPPPDATITTDTEVTTNTYVMTYEVGQTNRKLGNQWIAAVICWWNEKANSSLACSVLQKLDFGDTGDRDAHDVLQVGGCELISLFSLKEYVYVSQKSVRLYDEKTGEDLTA